MRVLAAAGNTTMRDDGIGLRILEAIAQRNLAPDLELVDLSAGLVLLIDYFAPATEKIVVVDALLLGDAPGTVTIFDPDDAVSEKPLSGITTHEGDLMQTIALGRALGQPVPPMRVIGIEPQSMKPGMELSPALGERLKEYIATALREARS